MADNGENSNGRQLSMPLHNFKFPTWGHHKHLRCMKPNSSGIGGGEGLKDSSDFDGGSDAGSSKTVGFQFTAISPSKQRRNGSGGGSSAANSSGTWEIDPMSEKLINDFKVEAENERQRKQKAIEEEELNASRPWNLRSKRGGRGEIRMEEEDFYIGGGGSSGFQPPRLPMFRPTLTKEEIEADFLAMTGAKPPRRSQRRPKPIQRQLDNLVPGSRMRDVIPEMYEVNNANQGQARESESKGCSGKSNNRKNVRS